LAEFVLFFMQFYSWLVRKLCEFLGNYCWLVRKSREFIDNYSWLVRKWRENLDNYSWWALLGGRLPRPHFLDLDRARGNGHFLLQFVFKTDRKPVLVTLGPFGIHLGTGLALKIHIFAAIPKRFLRMYGFYNAIWPSDALWT
jgi:hypothetical protein